MKLLVTEKDPMVRQWLGAEAAGLGVTMVFAESRDEALRAIGVESPDCVVLDASSSAGELDAPLWTQLRSAPATQHLPLLLYSSSTRWQRVAELAASDVDGFIARPFTPEALFCAAQRAAARRGTFQA
jgi:CheY-like chemotaxis protein